MTKKPQPPAPVSTAQLDWNEYGEPLSQQFDDVYFSRHNGIDETRYVFLEQNRLPERLAALANERCASIHIGETGFGTGLNFLCAWQLRDQIAPNCHLQFTSVEKHPLTTEQLKKALENWPQIESYAEQLIEQYPVLTAGWHRVTFIKEKVDLNLFIGDALDGFISQKGPVDAWFLDGFAPAKNPAMWSQGLFQQLARLSKTGTSFSTFTAASQVREALKATGFVVTRVEGYGRKRHMLCGQLEVEATPARNPTPWFIIPKPALQTRTAIIIGGGLAGSATAFSLARRGWQVSLFERHSQAAQEASGNHQGILYTKLAAEASTKSDFYTAAYLYATHQLPQLLTGEYSKSWDACGVLQLAHTAKEAARQQQFLEGCPQPDTLVNPVSAAQASEIAGIPLTQGGLFFPQAGWVSPRALCHRYLDHPLINFKPNIEIAALDYHNGQWQLHNSEEEVIAQAPIVVLANAHDALRFDVSNFLPLKRIRGQVTHMRTVEPTNLRTVLCGNAYVAPILDRQLHIGATFNQDTDTPSLRIEDHQYNIEQVSTLAPALSTQQRWHELDIHQLTGRVGFRCTSPDYLPLVGPIPDRSAFISQYARLRKDATTHFETPGCYLPGLYSNTGHGSKGLISCPLAAELIAAQICDEAYPIRQKIVDALNPARFLIRDLVRRKI